MTITLTCVRRKNTIQGVANQCSSYVTPLYYIAKWYLRSILSQISCPKTASSIAHGYDFIEINLGKHDLTKLAIIISSYGPNSLIQIYNKQWGQFASNTKSSIAASQTNFHNYRNQWESTSTWASTSMRTMAQPHESMQWDYHLSKEKLLYKFNWTIYSTHCQI